MQQPWQSAPDGPDIHRLSMGAHLPYMDAAVRRHERMQEPLHPTHSFGSLRAPRTRDMPPQKVIVHGVGPFPLLRGEAADRGPPPASPWAGTRPYPPQDRMGSGVTQESAQPLGSHRPLRRPSYSPWDDSRWGAGLSCCPLHALA